ncbi:hypothetical protein LTR36_009003 [Oleoguttula mirabilis]|uniref:Uncharacterized protein n=1 Tax=Oleoguttula mirabilis TaxID=1507867 RepID=A0AAV9J7K5_9PEZI|nr:hypothetical protein LTR36_009003 [Oleoguttula mirabilis]
MRTQDQSNKNQLWTLEPEEGENNENTFAIRNVGSGKYLRNNGKSIVVGERCWWSLIQGPGNSCREWGKAKDNNKLQTWGEDTNTWYAFFFSIEDGEGKPAAWGPGAAKIDREMGSEMEKRKNELEAWEQKLRLREEDVKSVEQQRADLADRERETGVEEAEQKAGKERLAESQRKIEARQTEQKGVEQQLARRTEELTEKERKLAVKETELAEQEKKLADKEKELAEKDNEGCPRCKKNREVALRQIELLKQQASTIEDLERQLTAREAESREEKERLSKQAEEISATKAELDKQAESHAATKAELDKQDKRLTAKEAELAAKQQSGAATDGDASAGDKRHNTSTSDDSDALKREVDALQREAKLQKKLADTHEKARQYAEKEAARAENDFQQTQKEHEKLKIRLDDVEKRLKDAKKAACPDPSRHDSRIEQKLANTHKEAREYAEKEAARAENDLQQTRKEHEQLKVRLDDVEKKLREAKKAACPDPPKHDSRILNGDPPEPTAKELERLKTENERLKRLVGRLVRQQQQKGKAVQEPILTGQASDANGIVGSLAGPSPPKAKPVSAADYEYQAALKQEKEMNNRLKLALGYTKNGNGQGSRPAAVGNAPGTEGPSKQANGDGNGGRTRPSGDGARQSADGKPSGTGNAGLGSTSSVPPATNLPGLGPPAGGLSKPSGTGKNENGSPSMLPPRPTARPGSLASSSQTHPEAIKQCPSPGNAIPPSGGRRPLKLRPLCPACLYHKGSDASRASPQGQVLLCNLAAHPSLR